MKAIILDDVSKAELLAMLRGTSKAADKQFDDEAGDIITKLSEAVRKMAEEHEDELSQLRDEHTVNAEELFAESCEFSGFPAELVLFLRDFRLLLDMVETYQAEQAWRTGRSSNVIDIQHLRKRK